MQFSNTTTKDGLIQDCERLTELGDATISGSTQLMKEFTALLNQSYNKVVTWILEVQGNWEWDDSNYDDSFPIATTTLVAEQQDYILPGATAGANFSTFLRLLRVEVKDSAGNYQQLQPFDERNVDGLALDELYQTSGMPAYYRQVGNSLELYPKPAAASVTTSEGLKAYYQRVPEQFETTDTTKQPGIPLPFHPLISKLAAHSYYVNKKVWEAAAVLKKEIYGDSSVPDDKGMKGELQKLFASRNQDVPMRMVARSRRTRYD